MLIRENRRAARDRRRYTLLCMGLPSKILFEQVILPLFLLQLLFLVVLLLLLLLVMMMKKNPGFGKYGKWQIASWTLKIPPWSYRKSIKNKPDQDKLKNLACSFSQLIVPDSILLWLGCFWRRSFWIPRAGFHWHWPKSWLPDKSLWPQASCLTARVSTSSSERWRLQHSSQQVIVRTTYDNACDWALESKWQSL